MEIVVIDCTPLRQMRPDISLEEWVKIHEMHHSFDKFRELLCNEKG